MRRPREVLAALLILTGCAHYSPRPLVTADAAGQFNRRRLDDPALLRALDSAGAGQSGPVWSESALAEAAWILRPERARAAAEIQVAQAARITAGAHERPGVLTETEYSFSGTRGESRWGIALSGVFSVEIGGKRGARIGRANAGVMAAAARADLEGQATRWRVHEAAVRWAMQSRLVSAEDSERSLLDSVALLTHARFEEGVISRSELSRVDADGQTAAAEAAISRQARAAAFAALAASVGVPVAELERMSFFPPALDGCPSPLSRDSVQSAALQRRGVLRVALADYQVAEAELRVEVANSWPDLQLGPGVFFDHGVGKWTFGFGLPSLPLGGNRGPIAEAEARREVAARKVMEAQDQVLEEVEEASVTCSAAAALDEAVDFRGARDRLRLATEAYARGETGRLEVMLARLELRRAERRGAEAAVRQAEARLGLERSIGGLGSAELSGVSGEGR